MSLVLAGDIGGTNTRLCLAEINNEGMSILKEDNEISSRSYQGLVPLVQKFLDGQSKPEKASFAIAGPVINNKCKITNLPWDELDAQKLQDDLNISQIALINDFVAIGYNIILEENKSLICLQEGEYIEDAPIFIIGAGTGLGIAFATSQGNSYEVYPAEAGHQNFAPHNKLTQELLDYLRNGDEMVDVESVVSGPGIVNIFNFLKTKPEYSGEDVDDFLGQKDLAKAISERAKEGDELCQETMEVFVEAYGAAAGDLAVFLPFGGIYIAGGIASQNVELMKNGKFIQALKNKARVNPALLEKVPVNIVSNTFEGLRGAVKYASLKM